MGDPEAVGSRVPWRLLRVVAVGVALVLVIVWLGAAVVRLTRGQPVRAFFDLAVVVVLGAWLLLLGIGSRSPTPETEGGVTLVVPTKATAARSAVVSSAFPLLLGFLPVINRTTAEPTAFGRAVGALWLAVVLLSIRFYRLDRSRTVTISDSFLRMTNPDLLRPGRVIERSRRIDDIKSARKQRLAALLLLLPSAQAAPRANRPPGQVARRTVYVIPTTALPRDELRTALTRVGTPVER